MDQDIGSEAPVDPAAAAFDALRREVALLNVALAGLAAERTSAPDYSETLGEIAQGVRVAIGRLGKVLASPALAASPIEMAREIAAAGGEARRLDQTALHQAQEALARAARDLRGSLDGARLARVQDLRLIQAALTGVLVGMLVGAWAPGLIVRAAPAPWHWPERMAAHVLRRDLWAAGEAMLLAADPIRLSAMRTCRDSRERDAPESGGHRSERKRRDRR